MEDKKIKAGKPYEELTAEEKALIVDFKEEEHCRTENEIRETTETCHRTGG